MPNGSRVSSQGVGAIHLISLSIDNILYVYGLPLTLSINRLTHSIDCVIYFTKDFFSLQDRSLGRIICTKCESHGLYHLQTSAHVDTTMDSPSLLHAQASHPSLVKVQQLVSRLSMLSSLSCESCHLGKHSRSFFPISI